MDVASILIDYLDGATDVEWYHNVPASPPAEYGTLVRSGGPTEIGRDLPTVTLLVHAETRGRASALADQAKQALLAAQYGVAGVYGAEILGDYYDPVDGLRRHRITASLVFDN